MNSARMEINRELATVNILFNGEVTYRQLMTSLERVRSLEVHPCNGIAVDFRKSGKLAFSYSQLQIFKCALDIVARSVRAKRVLFIGPSLEQGNEVFFSRNPADTCVGPELTWHFVEGPLAA